MGRDGRRSAPRTPANSAVTDSNPWWTTLRFEGTDPDTNVFEVSAGDLQTAKAIEIRFPDTATALIRVTGTGYNTTALTSVRFWTGNAYQQLDGSRTASNQALRERVAWVFPDATSLTVGPNLAWEGTILAPRADVHLPGSSEIRGSLIANSATGTITTRTAALRDDVLAIQ